MDQYRPCGEVTPRSPLRRRITPKEFEEALRAAQEEGLGRLDRREQIRIRLF
jgi:putative pyruvate formate lyase activating enzyme